jgi:hypothetical protein
MPAVGAATSWLYDSPVVEPLRLRRVPLLTAAPVLHSAISSLSAGNQRFYSPPPRSSSSRSPSSACARPLALQSSPPMRSGSSSAAGARRSSPPSRNRPRSIISPTDLPATSRALSSAFARFLRRRATLRTQPSSPTPGMPTPTPIRSQSTSTSSPSSTSRPTSP